MMGFCDKHASFEPCPDCIRELRQMQARERWCLKMARLEGDSEIGAGATAFDPIENPRAQEEGE